MSYDDINPATGLPMNNGVDSMGNPYGFSSDDLHSNDGNHIIENSHKLDKNEDYSLRNEEVLHHKMLENGQSDFSAFMYILYAAFLIFCLFIAVK